MKKGIHKYIANEHPMFLAKGGIVDPENPDSYLKISAEDPLLFENLTDEQKLSVFGNYAPTLDDDTEKLTALQNNFLKSYKGTPQYYVPKKGFVAKKDYDTYTASIPQPKAIATPTEVKSAIASQFKPKYPRVNTPEWDENQVRIKEEQEKRALAKVNSPQVQYKATGGVVDSALEDDEVNVVGKSKKQSTKGKDIAHDVLLGTAEMSMPFAPDLIKEKDYKSRYGANINKNTHGVTTVANSTAEGILHAIFPATIAASGAKNSIVKSATSEDEAISQKQRQQEGSIGAGMNMAGSLIGGKLGKKKENNNPTPANDVVSTQEGQTVVQRNYTKQDASLYSPDTFDINTLDNADKQGYVNAKTNEEKISYLRTIGYYSKGGEIVGKGTGTSDSIDGTLDGKGFVVPAENADKAIALRAKYFGNPDKVATLKGGDAKVKVSDGEHYFTPEERAILEANGEDLDALAPDANDGQKSYKCGGGVKKLAAGGPVEDENGDPVKDEIARNQKERKQKKNIQDKITQREIVKTAVKSALEKRAEQERLVKDAYGDKYLSSLNDYKASADQLKNEREKYLRISKALKEEKAISEKWKKDGNSETKRLVKTNLTDKDLIASENRIKELEQKSANYKKQLDKDGIEFEKARKVKLPIFDEKKGSIDEHIKKSKEVITKEKEKPSEQKTTTNTSTTTDVKSKGVGAEVKGTATPNATTTTKKETPATDVPASKKWLDTVYSKDDLATMKMRGMDGYDNKDKTIVDVTKPVENTTATTTTTKEKGKGILGTIDAEKALAVGQASLGITQLLNDGPRPVDSIDSDFQGSVNQAKTDAEFGLSPLERSIADQNIERSRRGGIRQIIAMAGGNAGAAMSNISAINIANADNINNLALTSERMLMEKKRYRDSLIGMKAGMARQLFQDKLNAFEQDQMAGANLLGAGIKNYIGATRYDKQLQAEKDIEANKNKPFDATAYLNG
jgi:hypothetical protein